MRLGIVIPEELMQDTCSYIEKEFPEEQVVPFPYHFISEIPEVLQGHQSRADSFLFLGETARFYASREIQPTIPGNPFPVPLLPCSVFLCRHAAPVTPCALPQTCMNRRFFKGPSGKRA